MKPDSIIFHGLKMEIPVKTGKVTRYYGEIKYIVCSKPECEIYCIDNSKYSVTVPLKYLADHLPDAFFRCNKSAIVNLHYYMEYNRRSLQLVMEDRKTFSLSVRKIAVFRKRTAELHRISSPCEPCFTCTEGCSARTPFCIRHKTAGRRIKRISPSGEPYQ
jgi:hypothetical protein